jgi:AFG3 family protein
VAKTVQIMDVEVRGMVDEAYQRTLSLVSEKKEQIQIIAEYLMVKETITNADVTRLIGARAYSSKEYAQYVEAGQGWGKEDVLDSHEPPDHAVGGATAAATDYNVTGSSTAKATADAEPAGTDTSQKNDSPVK